MTASTLVYIHTLAYKCWDGSTVSVPVPMFRSSE